MMKVIIVGGVAAGMSAASKIKRLDKDVEVTVYEMGEHLSYGACGLPYFVGGLNDDASKMIARTEDAFEKMGIKVHTKHEVMKVIPKDKKIMVRNLQSGDMFIESYDKLMVATGASAVTPRISGVTLEGVYQLKTLEDGLKLKEVVRHQEIKKVVVVGGGYIGIEVVDAFLELGKEVVCIEYGPRILQPFDQEITEEAEKVLEASGVRLQRGEKVEALEGNQKVEKVITNKGSYEADLVILAIGVRPATGFIQDTGIHLAENGAIVVDREMRTSVADIWAAGDCAMVYHRVLEENTFLPLGTVANKCGRIAGENILGYHKKFIGAVGSSGIKVCDLEIGRTGLSESDAQRLKIDYGTVITYAYDHPSYYPNQTPIKIKLIYEVGSMKLLGAQAVGQKGAVLRIDVFAVAIHNGMTTEELGMLDLVYAPPFAGVWDAVHIACNAAKNKGGLKYE